MDTRAIGVFDSGIGGLTVVKEIINLLPQENIIYLGDTARVPYGTRGKETITEFALELTHFLLQKDIKLLVVACNTISATCLDQIQELSTVPVVGVISPAVNRIVKTTKTGRVGVIGTRATVSSEVYEKEIHALSPDITVTSIACPLFVPIAEEGLGDSGIARLTAKQYLAELTDIDTLHLGCTHYPLLRNVIQETVGPGVNIIDSALPTAQEVERVLTEKNMRNATDNQVTQTYFVTDAPERVGTIAELFLGKVIKYSLHKVELHI